MSVEAIRPNAEAIRPPEPFEVGKILNVTEVTPAEVGIIEPDLIPAQIVKPTIYDPNIAYLRAVRPGRFKQIRRHEKAANDASFAMYKLGKWRTMDKPVAAYENDEAARQNEAESTPDGSVANNDLTTRNYFFGEKGVNDPALRVWRDLVPGAVALLSLSNPYGTKEIVKYNRQADKVIKREPTTDVTREWMTGCTDGREIRNRTAIHVEEVGTFLGKYAQTHPGEKMTVLSIAGGTALPTMQAIMRSGVDPALVKMVVIERDPVALKMIEESRQQLGFTGEIEIKQRDVFDPAEMKQVKEELDAAGDKVVAADAVGIAEYSSELHKTADRVAQKGEDYLLYNPDKFIAACLDFVDEDGMLIVGQMRNDRHNAYFTRGVVGWPYITLRSVNSFARLLKQGGADMSLTKFNLTPVKTYTMASMYKSEIAANMAGLGVGEYKVEEPRVTLSAAFARIMHRRRCVGSAAGRHAIQF